ncbi:MAG: YdbH domain-containing protein [Opitutaceae bacterium]|nr:YdbH domain-containing protein [Opitutaceae bacterium]
MNPIMIVRKLAGVFRPRRNAWLAAFGALLLWTQTDATANPSLLKLPMFDGEVSGDFAMPGIGVECHWRMTAGSPRDEPGIRRGRLEVDGMGAHIVARATLDLASGVTRWEIEDATADLAEVFPALAPLHLPDFAHLGVTGSVSAGGGGQLTPLGDFSGAVILTITDAAVRDFFGGWAAEGINLRVEFPALPALETKPAQRLTLSGFTHEAAGVEIRDAETDIGCGNDGRIHFSNTKLSACGGVIFMEPFSLNPSALDVSTRVRVEGIDSESLAAFLPGSIAEAHGRFSGELSLGWSPATGVVPGIGKLELIKAPGAAIRLARTPGFFTSDMTPRLYFLPKPLGFLRRIFSLENPAYDTLKKIEESEMSIDVDAITINFTPDGDEAGRSATIVIAARPADRKSAVKNLRINVNVTGPITKVLEMGTTDRVQIGF